MPDDQRVYLIVPEGVNISDDHVLECLLRALYGLKQAPRFHLRAAITTLGYRQSLNDPRVFFLARGDDFSIVGVVVDDILQADSLQELIDHFI